MGGRKEQELPQRRSGREACFFLICFACICICILLIIQHRHPPFHPTKSNGVSRCDRQNSNAGRCNHTNRRAGGKNTVRFPHARSGEKRKESWERWAAWCVLHTFCYRVLVLFGTAGRQRADSRQAGITMTSNKTKIGRTLPRDRYRLL